MSGSDIFWNAKGWSRGTSEVLEIVDGKQRLDAVLGFFADKVLVFGDYFHNFDGHLSLSDEFHFYINDLEDPKDVVQWYIDLNTGGSIHTEKDLSPAYKWLDFLKTLK